MAKKVNAQAQRDAETVVMAVSDDVRADVGASVGLSSMDAARAHIDAGRLRQAEEIARTALAGDARHYEAASLLGVIAFRVGRYDEAISWMVRAAHGDPQVAGYHANLCEMFRIVGRNEEALKAGARAVMLDPAHASAHNNIGVVYIGGGDFIRGEAACRRAVSLAPDFADAHNNLGNALRGQGKIDEAEGTFRRAIALNPDYFEALSNCGAMLRDAKRMDVAEPMLRKALKLRSTHVDAHVQLALNCQMQGDARQDKADTKASDEALSLLTRAVALDPTRAEAFLVIARILAARGKTQGAITACRRALNAKPDHPAVLNLLARLLRDTDDISAAIDYCRQALVQSPDAPDILNNLGIALLESGDLDGAADALSQAISAAPQTITTYINLASARKFKASDSEIVVMEKALVDLPLSDRNAIGLRYALGKVCDDIGEHERAFTLFSEGAAMKRQQVTYNEGGIMRLFERIQHVFTPEFVAEKAGLGDADARHVFIVGMPRSGSTLIEQILASHASVQALGEVKHLHNAILSLDEGFAPTMRYPELAHMIDAPQLAAIARHYHGAVPTLSAGKLVTTDKMLTNYYYVGLIYLLFPNARVIYSRRNAIDTCLSCYSKLFREDMAYTYDLGELARYHRKCTGLMEHWKKILPEGFILDVDYENVVGDIEAEAQRIVAHCGLPWDPACLDFHKNARTIKTASAAQVRRPLYASSVERWRRYGAAVDPLAVMLGLGDTARV